MPFIKCTRDSLLKPLQIVGGIVEGRQSMASFPIFSWKR